MKIVFDVSTNPYTIDPVFRLGRRCVGTTVDGKLVVAGRRENVLEFGL